MNRPANTDRPAADDFRRAVSEARFARRVAAHLTAASLATSPDIDERLRVARERAVTRARELRRTQEAPAVVGTASGGAAMLGGPSGPAPVWQRLAALLPLLMMVAGLLLIHRQHVQAQIRSAADVDVLLLADDVPPQAYADPGFLEFLKQTPIE